MVKVSRETFESQAAKAAPATSEPQAPDFDGPVSEDEGANSAKSAKPAKRDRPAKAAVKRSGHGSRASASGARPAPGTYATHNYLKLMRDACDRAKKQMDHHQPKGGALHRYFEDQYSDFLRFGIKFEARYLGNADQFPRLFPAHEGANLQRERVVAVGGDGNEI